MKKSSLLKVIVALPALALALSACDDKQEPFLDGYVMGFAVQVEDPENHGNFRYIPDIRAATASTSDVINPTIKKGSSRYLEIDSPFRDAFENCIDHGTYDEAKYNEITYLNGTYTFAANNTEMRDISASFTWDFVANSKFKEGWGENPDPNQRETADHYTKFSYDGTYVTAEVKPFEDDENVYYQLMSAQYMQINPAGNNDPVTGPIEFPDDFTLSRAASVFVPDNPIAVKPGDDLSEPIRLSWYLPNNQYHGTRVAIVAIKDVRDEAAGTYRGTVMLRTEFKTISKEKFAFYEDEYSVVSIAVTEQPTKKTYLVGEQFDPTGMVVTARYSDSSTATVPAEELTDDNFIYDFTTAGINKTVTVTYKGQETFINGITVTEPNP